jgi:hypothetical protein
MRNVEATNKKYGFFLKKYNSFPQTFGVYGVIWNNMQNTEYYLAF